MCRKSEEKWKIKYTSKIQKRRMMRKFYDAKLRQKVSEHMPHLGDTPEEAEGQASLSNIEEHYQEVPGSE